MKAKTKGFAAAFLSAVADEVETIETVSWFDHVENVIFTNGNRVTIVIVCSREYEPAARYRYIFDGEKLTME